MSEKGKLPFPPTTLTAPSIVPYAIPGVKYTVKQIQTNLHKLHTKIVNIYSCHMFKHVGQENLY